MSLHLTLQYSSVMFISVSDITIKLYKSIFSENGEISLKHQSSNGGIVIALVGGVQQVEVDDVSGHAD